MDGFADRSWVMAIFGTEFIHVAQGGVFRVFESLQKCLALGTMGIIERRSKNFSHPFWEKSGLLYASLSMAVNRLKNARISRP